MKELLKDESGSFGFYYALFLIFFTVVTMYIGLEYWRFQSDGKLIKSAIQSAVLNNASDNYNEIYDGTKTSVFANITYNDSTESFEFIDDEGDFYNDMKESLGIERINGEYCKSDHYCITINSIDIQSTSLIVNAQEKYTCTIRYTVEHYWRGGLKNLAPFDYDYSVKANYIPKY